MPVREGPRGGVTAYIVPCHGCGHNYRVAARTLRDLRQQGRVPYCDVCRRPSEISVTEADRRFWRDRFSEPEIVFMAESLFGPRSAWPERAPREDLALAASAARR